MITLKFKSLVWKNVLSWIIPALLLLIALSLPKDGVAGQRSPSDHSPAIICSIQPLAFFAQAIAGNHARISVMVPPGANPATYEPKPVQMAQLSSNAIYLSADLPFEQAWLPRFKQQNPGLRIIHINHGIALQPMDRKHQTMKTRAENMRNLDPHTWLSPPLAMLIARNIFSALIDLMPEKQDAFTRNYLQLLTRVSKLDTKIAALFRTVPKDQRVLLTFHPAWGYFADAYGFTQIVVEKEGKEPSIRELSNICSQVKRLGIDFILVQPQFSQKSAKALGSICNLRLITADPLSMDWDNNLLRLATLLAKRSSKIQSANN